MSFDAHTHAFPDDLAAHALARLQADCPWKPVGDGTAAGLLAAMDAAGIDRAFVCMIATKPSQADNILAFCARLRSDRLLPLASVHPDAPDAPAQLARVAGAALPGIKIHPLYQNCPIDDPRMDPLCRAASDLGLLVTAHCGRDVAFPPSDDRASPARIRRLLQRHPRLRFLATHLGGWQSWDDVETHLAGPEAVPSPENLFFEMSFCLPCMPPDRAVGLIRRLGPRRVLFGSDWPWASPADQRASLEALGLSAGELHLILQANPARLLGEAGPPP